jgi:hypothetical protein
VGRIALRSLRAGVPLLPPEPDPQDHRGQTDRRQPKDVGPGDGQRAPIEESCYQAGTAALNPAALKAPALTRPERCCSW